MGMGYTGKADLEMVKVFGLAYKKAYVKSVEYMFAKCFEYAPVRKTRKGAVNLRKAIMYDFDWSNNEAFIGLPRGSEMEKIAFYTEMGTGERGSSGWTQFFEEIKPVFTIPIVPLKAKAMHFVTESGEHVFLKKSKGQKPQSFMRRAFKDSEIPVQKIWDMEFSDPKIRELLKFKSI